MFPDGVAGKGGLIATFHHTAQGFKVRTIQHLILKGIGAFVNDGIIIFCLLEIEVVLAVVWVESDELPTHRAGNLAQNRLHMGQQIVSRFAAQLGDVRIIKTQAIP